jgi:hypothetical protein
MRRADAPHGGSLQFVHGGRRPDFVHPRMRDRNVARRALLQKQLGAPHHRLGVETRPHAPSRSALAIATIVMPWWCAMWARTTATSLPSGRRRA